MSDYIPKEIVVEILHRLPVKALIKCMSVCKSWRSFITHPSFISHHIHYSNGNCFFLLHLHPNNYYLHRNDQHLTHFSNHLHLPKFFRRDLHIVAICNGLLCLTTTRIECRTLYICNPCIRRYVALPKPHHSFSASDTRASIVFGFDSAANDYKILRIACTIQDEVTPPCAPLLEVYSFQTGVWKDITAVAPVSCLTLAYYPHSFVNGIVHWGADTWVDNNHYNLIVSFDFGNEVFGEVMLPESLTVCTGREGNVTVIRGGNSLTVSHRCLLTSCYDVWVMKEYGVVESWSKLFSFKCERPHLEAPSLETTLLSGMLGPPIPILLRNSDELLVLAFSVKSENKGLYSLDIDKKRFILTDIKIKREDLIWDIFHDYNAESIALLNKASRMVSY